VLWFASGENPRWPERLGIGPEKVTVQSVDHLDSSRALRTLDDIIKRDALRIPSVVLTEGVGGPESTLYLPVIDAIFAQLEAHRSARFFRQQQGFPAQLNVLANLPAYVRRRMPNSWAGALDSIPAFICGAGPSLNTSAAKLAEFAQHGVIFATDSALPALAKREIPADFALAVDPRKTPANCLPREARPPNRLMIASATLPSWLETVAEEQTLFLSGRQLTEDWLVANGVPKTAAGVTENCGTTAFELALFLGCRPLFLFGMDHAIDGNDATHWHHADFSNGLECQQLQARSSDYPTVPGNFQEKVATPFFQEWSKFDSRCSGLPRGLGVNVIDRGARIRNTTVVRPADFALASRGESKAARLARLGAADSIPEADARKLFDNIRRVAAATNPMIAEAREALKQKQLNRVAGLLVHAFTQKPFSQLMGNYTLKVIPHLLRSETVECDQWDQLITETGDLLALAGNLH
jgi:hypothetical protein